MGKGCDQCCLLRINGVVCHETGCPNSSIDPCTGTPYKTPCKGCNRNFTPQGTGIRSEYCYNCSR